MNAMLLAVALTSSVVCRESGRYDAWPSVTALKDGKTLVAVFSGQRLAHACPSGKVEVVRSEDGGRTWSRPERMSVVGSTPHGGIVLKNGSLLWVGRDTPGKNNVATAANDRPTVICCELSTDGGRTWQMLCARFPDVDGEGQRNHLFHEPHVAELPDGRLVALVRCHTWSAVDSFCLHRAPEGVAAGDIGYPATVLLADGCLYTVFYEPEQKDGKPCIWGVRWQAPESAR